jgi:hypothetical protein
MISSDPFDVDVVAGSWRALHEVVDDDFCCSQNKRMRRPLVLLLLHKAEE